jgi:hypothetical protein
LADTRGMGLSEAQIEARRKGGASWSPAKQASVGVAFEALSADQGDPTRHPRQLLSASSPLVRLDSPTVPLLRH